MALPLLLAAALQAAPAPDPIPARPGSPTEGLAAIFISACLDGELRLAPNQAKELRHDQLSSRDVDDARGSKSARYFKIASPAAAMLVIAQYDAPPGGGQTSLCMIDTPLLDLKAAVKLVHTAVQGMNPVHSFDGKTYNAFLPEAGVALYVSRTQMAVTGYDQAGAAKVARKLGAPAARAER